MLLETYARAGLMMGASLAAMMVSGGSWAQDNLAQEAAVAPRGGGVLTPEGQLVFEPSLEFQTSSSNNFTFQGVEIIDTVLIGIISAGQQEDDTITAAVGYRYGLTDRLEFEVKIPYVYRNFQSIDQTLVAPNTRVQDTNVSGGAIGDVEFAAHYQLNQGGGDTPIFVGNLRVKSDTGRGPFEVSRNSLGLETEVATGSGFWGVEPSITMLLPSDPAVIFGNLGYLWNISEDVDTRVGTTNIGTVDPGDAIRASMGMGIGLNEQLSISLSYKHDYILKTKINGVAPAGSDTLQVGAIGFGLTYQLNDTTSLNFNLDAGVTEDAPDVRAMVRMPVVLLR